MDEYCISVNSYQKNTHSFSSHALHFCQIAKAYLIKYDKHPFLLCHILPHPNNSQSETLLDIVHSQELVDLSAAMQLCMVLDVLSSLNSACPPFL